MMLFRGHKDIILDGRSAWLAHSGDDAFSVHEATFTPAADRSR